MFTLIRVWFRHGLAITRALVAVAIDGEVGYEEATKELAKLWPKGPGGQPRPLKLF